jgi:hypothetical protein
MLLRRSVPIEVASNAMEDWVAEHASVLLHPPAIQQARSALEKGEAIQDTLVLATGVRGARYTGSDLAAGWARMSPDQRTTLERADEIAFGGWVENDAREVLWAQHARLLGVEVPPSALPDSEATWYSRLGRWAWVFGFEPEMPEQRIRAAAMQALLSGTAEARSARAEIRSLRPLLRELHPLRYAEDF